MVVVCERVGIFESEFILVCVYRFDCVDVDVTITKHHHPMDVSRRFCVPKG